MNDAFVTSLSGRANRRTMLKGGAALGALTLLGSRVPVSPAAAAGKLEVFSWWTSPGEAPALQSLFDSFSKANPGVEIVNAAVAGGAGVNARAVLLTRLQGNQPPDSWQVHVGRELVDNYVVPGYCMPISDLYKSEGWVDAMPADLVAQASHEGEQYSVPVGVHRGNGFFFNKKVMSDNGIEVGETMTVDQFFAAADKLKAAGIPALALATKDTFAAAQTFENTLLGVAGPDNYRKLFKGEMLWTDDIAKESATAYGKMLDYINDDAAALTWDQATAMVIEGKAGFNSMGDWAYGEVKAKNAIDNIGWVSHPGTQGSFVLVVDSFTLPKGAPDPDNATAWLKAIGSKEAQALFNPIKGSIPARTDVDPSGFTDYGKWSMADFKTAQLVPSCAHGQASSPAFQQAFYDASLAFVTDKNVDTYLQTLADAAAAEQEA